MQTDLVVLFFLLYVVTVAGFPSNVRATVVSSTSILVTWNHSDTDMHGYRVKYSAMPFNSWDFMDTVDNVVVLRNLMQNKTYVLTVSTISSTGLEMGSITLFVSLKENVTKPSEPQNFKVKLVSHDPLNVQLTWEAPDRGEVIHYLFEYGVVGKAYEIKGIRGQENEYVMTNLEHGSVYEFRLSARNVGGLSERVTKMIRTPVAVPSSSPLHCTAKSVGHSSARLFWDMPGRSVFLAPITGHEIRYTQLNNPEEMNTKLQQGESTSSEIQGLKNNTKYVFRVRAFNTKGVGPWSEECRLQMNDSVAEIYAANAVYRVSALSFVARISNFLSYLTIVTSSCSFDAFQSPFHSTIT